MVAHVGVVPVCLANCHPINADACSIGFAAAPPSSILECALHTPRTMLFDANRCNRMEGSWIRGARVLPRRCTGCMSNPNKAVHIARFAPAFHCWPCVCVTVCFIFSDQSRLLSVDNRLINHLCMFTCWSKCAPLNDCESVLCQCRGAHENQ